MGNKFNFRSQFDSIMLMKNALIEELRELDTPYCSYFAIPPVLAKDEMEIRSEILTKPYFGEVALINVAMRLRTYIVKMNTVVEY